MSTVFRFKVGARLWYQPSGPPWWLGPMPAPRWPVRVRVYARTVEAGFGPMYLTDLPGKRGARTWTPEGWLTP